MYSIDFIQQLPHIASTAIMLLVAGLVLFTTPSKEYGRPFALLISLIAIYTIGIMVGNMAKTNSQQTIVHTTAVVFVILTVPAWIIFITSYSGFGRWLTPSVQWIIWSISFVFALIMAFNHWLQWMFIVEYVGSDPADTIRNYAVLSYVYLAYTTGTMVYGGTLFWYAVSNSKGVFRRQFLFMMLGIVLLLTGIIITFFLTPGSYWSLIVRPTFSFLSGIAFLLGIYLSRLFDVIPLSRKTFFEQAQTGFVACDEAGRIIDVNPAAVTLFDQPLVDLIGQHYKQAFTIFSEALDPVLFTSSQPTQHELEIALPAPDEETISPRWFNVEASPIHAQGQRRGTSLILRDITQEKESKKLRDTLNRMIYHDLSQPVEAIMFSVALAQHAAAMQNAEQQEKYMASVEEASERLLNMMKELQTINRSKMQSLQLNLNKYDLNNIIAQTIDMHTAIAQSKHITLTQETPTTPCIVAMDVDLIRRVLDNLVTNAMRFTQENGRILIKLNPIIDTPHMLSISVIDNGSGLQTDDHEQLFQEGVSIGEKKSSGLGLAFCRMVIEAHNGRIQFDPVPTGTQITFTLPK